MSAILAKYADFDFIDYADPIHKTTPDDLTKSINAMLRENKTIIDLNTALQIYDKFAIRGCVHYIAKGFFNSADFKSESPSMVILPSKVYCVIYSPFQRYFFTINHNDVDIVTFRKTVYDYIKNHFDTMYQTLIIPNMGAKRGIPLLVEFARNWDNHKRFAECLRQLTFLAEPRKTYMGTPSTIPTITSLAHNYFKEKVYDLYKPYIMDIVQDQIMKDRLGEPVETQSVKSMVELYCVMGLAASINDFKDKNDVVNRTLTMDASKNTVYIDDFETVFVGLTNEYYQALSDKWINECSVPEYLVNAEKSFNIEEELLSRYCHTSTAPKLLTQLTQTLLIRYHNALLMNERTGFVQLLNNHCESDIGRMYRMFVKFENGVVPMTEMLCKYIIDLGNNIIDQRRMRLAGADGKKYDASDVVFIQQLISLHNKYVALVHDYMENNPSFQKTIQDAFKTIMNTSPREDEIHPTSELLAVFVDMVLKGKVGDEKMTEEQITTLLTDSHAIFGYLHDKDHFQEFYRNHLSRRLLQSRSHSSDAEKHMISLLKSTHGATFTQRFEAMITNYSNPDVAVPVAEFKEDLAVWTRKRQREDTESGVQPRDTIDFEVRVLCGGSWPSMYDTSTLVMPIYLRELTDFYTYHFNERHGGTRRLAYAHTEGQMIIRANIGEKAQDWKEFTMMPIQAMILLQFNERTELTPSALAKLCGLNEEEVMKLIHPLIFAPVCKLLENKNVKPGGKFMASDVLTVNTKFKNPLKRIAVPFIAMREKSVINSSETETQRKHVVDATVIRVMKSRKTMRFDALIAETQRQIRIFNADIRLIKSRIDDLINKEYLERSEQDRTELSYLA